MHAKVDHVAIKVYNLEESIRFFQEVFEMSIEKTAGTKPMRKIWFHEGIQLNEVNESILDDGIMDHIGIHCDCKNLILERSKKFGCTALPNGDNWFRTPTGIRIELK